MPPKKRSVDQLADALGEHLRESLLRMREAWEDQSVPPGFLVFPTKRNEACRVSEQESKIIAADWLRREQYPFSIETPTGEVFRQRGAKDLSALTDVTVYSHGRAGLGRILNIELKAHQPNRESFRKDLEKLLREGVDGMWFHTLESADGASWTAIGRKLWWSYRTLSADPKCRRAFQEQKHAVRFKFLVLRSGEMDCFTVRFAHWKADLGERFPEVDFPVRN